MAGAAPAPAASIAPGAVVASSGPQASDDSAFGGPNAAQMAAAESASDTKPVAQTSTTPLLTTSSASRSTTANNVSTINGAVSNAAAGNANAGTTTPTTLPPGTSVTPATSTTPATGSTTTPAPTTTYTPPAGATETTLPGGATGYYTAATGTTPESMTDAQGNPLQYSNAVGTWIDPATGAPPATASSSSSIPGSTGGATAADGTISPTVQSIGDITASLASTGLAPSLQSLYANNIQQQQQQQAQAYQTLEQAKATLANDPAALAAVAAINAKYQVLIDAMNLKNTQVLGKASNSVAAFGGLGTMSTNFMSDQMDAASSRIATIVSEQQNAVLTAQSAYGKEDLAAFNTAMTAYQKTITDMNTSLIALNTATDKQVTQTQAQAKIDLSTQNDQVANDVKTSTANAGSVYSYLVANGIDLSKPDALATPDAVALLQQEATAMGISDWNSLSGEVAKYALTANNDASLATSRTAATADRAQTTNDTNLKTQYTINKPYSVAGGVKPGTDGTYNYTAADLTSGAQFLKQGGTVNGQTFAPRGADSYVDPGAYIALFNNWVAAGGTAKGFLSKFPVKSNVNPTSVAALPTALQPTTAAATTIQH